MDRCDECGFVYDLEDASAAAGAIINGVDVITSWLLDPDADLRTRRAADTWSPLEYGCHLRDVLLVQRERVLATQWIDTPEFHPMGRDERAGLGDAASMFANVLRRLDDPAWDRTLTYNYPGPMVRSLRWVAVHTVHEVHHHAQDIERQLGS